MVGVLVVARDDVTTHDKIFVLVNIFLNDAALP